MFTEYDLDENLRNFLNNIRKEIESDRNILESDENEYKNNKISKHKIEPLSIFPEEITLSQKEYPIPAEYFPAMFDIERGESYPKPVLTFHIPFKGDAQWLKCRPSTFLSWTTEVDVEDSSIIFEIINFDNDVEKVKRDRDSFVKNLQTQIANINQNISNYNKQLESFIEESIKNSKNKFKEQDDFLSKLGNPLK